MTDRTRIQYRSFTCPDAHSFRAAVMRRIANGISEEFFQSGDSSAWLPVPKCPAPDCPLIGDEDADLLSRSFISVPSSERAEAWVSPDGTRMRVPGKKGFPMPERYRRAGYIRIEASNLRDIDRLDRIRAAETGNAVYNEMSAYGPAARNEREQADYTDDPTSET